MRNAQYFFIIATLLLACQSIDKAPEPKTLIKEDRMVEILTDIAFVKAAKSSQRKVFEENKINPEAYILEKYHIDSIVFAENNTWYASQLETYSAIFAKVKANLDIAKIKYEKLKKEEDSIKKVQDSLKKVKDSMSLKKDPVSKEVQIAEDIEKAKNKRFKSLSKKE